MKIELGTSRDFGELGQSRWGIGGRHALPPIFESPEDPSLLIELARSSSEQAEPPQQ